MSASPPHRTCSSRWHSTLRARCGQSMKALAAMYCALHVPVMRNWTGTTALFRGFARYPVPALDSVVIGDACEVSRPAERRYQAVDVDRLDQMGVEAGLRRARVVVGAAVAGERDQAHRLAREAPPDLRGELVAVHAG